MEPGDTERAIYNKTIMRELKYDPRNQVIRDICEEGGEIIDVGGEAVVVRIQDRVIKVYPRNYQRSPKGAINLIESYKVATSRAAYTLRGRKDQLKIDGRDVEVLWEVIPVDRVYEREGFPCTESRYIAGQSTMFTFKSEAEKHAYLKKLLELSSMLNNKLNVDFVSITPINVKLNNDNICQITDISATVSDIGR